MSQTKKQSMIETYRNIGSGFIIALLIWEFVLLPLMNVGLLDKEDSFLITIIFVISSYIRSFLWRRYHAKKFSDKQTSFESMIEKFIDTATAILISVCVWEFLFLPLINVSETDWFSEKSTYIIIPVYTIISVVRSYYWRRFFATGLHKIVHRFFVKNKLNSKGV